MLDVTSIFFGNACSELLLMLNVFFSLLKVLLSTLAFTAFELPPNGAIGTKILQFLFHSRSDLVRQFLYKSFCFIYIYKSFSRFSHDILYLVSSNMFLMIYVELSDLSIS